jgi:hypothetical protein
MNPDYSRCLEDREVPDFELDLGWEVGEKIE